MDFNVSVSGWDFAKGVSFRVSFAYSGTNAASYETQLSDYVTFSVSATDADIPPVTTLDDQTIDVGIYSFSIDALISSAGYAYYLVLPKGQTGPTTGEALVGFTGNVDTTARFPSGLKRRT